MNSESHTSSPYAIDYAPRHQFDADLFVARYLRVVAVLCLASSIAASIHYDSLLIDFSALFYLWAASALKRHSAIARKWVIGLCIVYIVTCGAIVGTCLIRGVDKMNVRFAGAVVHPAAWQILVATGSISLIEAVPLFLLLTRNAHARSDAVTA